MNITPQQLDNVITLAKRYGATRLFLFGSAIKNIETASDLDFACEGVTGWKIYQLGAELEEMLNQPVDLIPLDPATPFTELIQQEAKLLL